MDRAGTDVEPRFLYLVRTRQLSSKTHPGKFWPRVGNPVAISGCIWPHWRTTAWEPTR